jgi:hypothetical protein
MRAEVVAVDSGRRSVSLKPDRGDERTITSAYLDEGWLDHGYALTAHTAEGATVDQSFVLGSDELYREWGYTAMSRHRDQARFYVVSPGSVERALPGLERDNEELADDVVSMLSPTRSKDMALNVVAEGGVARTVRSLDEIRAAILIQRERTGRADGTRADALTKRDRWMRDAVNLVGRQALEPPTPSAVSAIDDLGMDF